GADRRRHDRLGSKAVFAALKCDFRITPESGLWSDIAACLFGAKADASKFSLKIPKADGRLAPRTSTIGTGCCSAQPILSSVVPVRPLSAIGWLAVLCGAPWRQPRNPP